MYDWTRSLVWNRRTRLTSVLLALSIPLLLPGGGCGLGQNAEVTSIEPNHGPAAGGTQVTVLGSSLEMPLAVTFNNVAATNLQLLNGRALTLVTPPGAPGAATVTLIFADGGEITVPNAFTYDEDELSASESLLSITSITPPSGPVSGGTEITVQGTNFVPESVLLIGGQPATNLVYVGENLLMATTPAGTEGVADVIINTGDGRSTAYPPGFTYLGGDSGRGRTEMPEICAVNPNCGPECGKTCVTVEGRYFECGSVVLFDGILALETKFITANILQAVTPPHCAGEVDVKVVLPDGACATLEDGFEYFELPDPYIDSISPTQGPMCGGTTVTIRGGNFWFGTQVFFGCDVAQSVCILSTQCLVAVTPPHCEGEVDVTVQNPDCREARECRAFCYVGLDYPVICSIEPECGPCFGGTLVTIVGQNFRPPLAVLFDDIASPYVDVINGSTLTAITPPHAPGRSSVKIINCDGTCVTERCGFDYLAPVPLEVFSFDPDEGPAGGGTVVTILGRGFQPGAIVLFGTILALDVDVISSEIMTAVAPPQEGCTVVCLTVTLPDCQSFTTDDTFEYEADEPTISCISPPCGPECGGTVVTIAGTNFEDVVCVRFGCFEARQFAVLSDNLIQAVTPPGCGPVVVKVISECAEDAEGIFEYVPPDKPSIGQLCPDRGPECGGTVVTITGTRLRDTFLVKFDGICAPIFTALSDTLLEVVTPPGCGTVVVQVVTFTGCAEALFTYVPPPQPVICKLEPECGPASGGTVVCIRGYGFKDTERVTFGCVPACEFVVLCDELIQAVTPPGYPGTTVVVEVETYFGEAEALFTYLYPDAPAIHCVAPPCGPEEGGTYVLLTGCGFANTCTVDFDMTAVPFFVLSDRQIITWSPPGYGTVPVIVTTPFGSAAGLFTYIPEDEASIASLTPNTGPEAGGTVVTITGTELDETTDVTFGGIPANFAVLSDTVIEAISPPGVGTVAVVVYTPYGNPQAFFTYIPPGTPTISSLIPPTGPEAGGTVVTITGTGFTGTTNVKFGGIAAPQFAVLSDSLIEAITPPGTGTVDVEVITPNGTVRALFTYVPPAIPTIGQISPDRGPEAGGTVVTITGTGFADATDVTFGGDSAPLFTVLSDTLIQALTPPGTGTVVVRVITPEGTAEALFTYIPPGTPAISTVEPPFGPACGGTVVTICGCNLTCVTDVTFGCEPAEFVVLCDNCIQVIAPEGCFEDGDDSCFSGETVLVTVETCNGDAEAFFTYLFPDEPVIFSVLPPLGPEAGGTAVVITGEGFFDVDNVLFDGSAALFTLLSDDQILAYAPPGTGTVPIVVITMHGSAAALFTYIAPGLTTVGSITPDQGPESGGTTVLIQGTGFTGTTSVTFGPNAAFFTVVNDNQIIAKSPAGTGTVAVVVESPTGFAAGLFTYILPLVPIMPVTRIDSLTPNSGPTTGENTVLITGVGFTGATSVEFGPHLALFSIVNDNQILATAPAGTGQVAVVVTSPTGMAAALYTYVAPNTPTITGISPSSGPIAGDTVITITGTGFSTATDVKFGGISTLFAVLNDNTVQALLPATAFPGVAVVRVVTPNGDATALFTYVAAGAPTITSLTPASGPQAGGTGVLINGTNFTDTTAVTFGGVPSVHKVLNDTQIFATTPPGTGTELVQVITPQGDAGAFFTYVPPETPFISSLTPTSGPESGGTTVLISGTGLSTVTDVTFGPNPAMFSIVNDNQITAVSPAGAGTVAVKITSPNGDAVALFTYIPPTPTAITSVNPSSGPEAGGTVVLIDGVGFTGTTTVLFNLTPAPFIVISDTQLATITPAGTGTEIVTVVSPTGNGSSLFTFVPPTHTAITSVAPDSGPAAGGTTVLINGVGFTGTTSVMFGADPGTGINVLNDHQLVVTSPAGTGTVVLTVTSPTGTAGALFTYVLAPTPPPTTITSIEPPSGPAVGGNSVVINGHGFTGTLTVTFGIEFGLPFVLSDTQLLVIVPPGVAGTTVPVVVVSPTGTAASIYTYN